MAATRTFQARSLFSGTHLKKTHANRGEKQRKECLYLYEPYNVHNEVCIYMAMHVCSALSLCEHALPLCATLWQYDALCARSLFMHSYLFHMHVCVCALGEEARIQVPQSVRQHLVRQASVMAPQGKAAYCGHEPWWLSLLGGLHMRTCTQTHTHKRTCRSTYKHVCTCVLADTYLINSTPSR